MIKSLALCLILASPAHAKPFFGLSVGRFNGTKELSSSFIGGAEAGIESKGFVYSLGADFIQQEMREGFNPEGSVTLTPILAKIQGKVPVGGLSVSLGGGVGWCLSSFELSKELNRINELNTIERLEVDIKNDFCYQVGVGIEKKLSSHTTLGFELDYFFYDTQFELERIRKDAWYRYPSTSLVSFSSVLGKICLRFK